MIMANQKIPFREWLGLLAQSFSYRLLVSWAGGCEAMLDGAIEGDLRKVYREIITTLGDFSQL